MEASYLASCASASVRPVAAFARALQARQDDVKCVLDASDRALTDTDLSCIAQALQVNVSITVLELRGHVNLTVHAVEDLVAAVTSSDTVLMLRLENMQLPSTVGRALVGALGAQLPSPGSRRSLRSLSLAGNQIGDAGAEILSVGLFSMPGLALAELDLGANGIGASGAEAIAKALSGGAPALEILRLGRNPLGDAGVVALASACLAVRNLAVLDLSDVTIGGRGGTAIVDLLGSGGYPTTLETLLLTGIGKRVADGQLLSALAAATQTNTVVQRVDLSPTLLDTLGPSAVPAAQQISDVCAVNRRVSGAGAAGAAGQSRSPQALGGGRGPSSPSAAELGHVPLAPAAHGRGSQSAAGSSSGAGAPQGLSLDSIDALLQLWAAKMERRWAAERDRILSQQQQVLRDAMVKQTDALEQVAEEVRWVDEENIRARAEEKATLTRRLDKLESSFSSGFTKPRVGAGVGVGVGVGSPGSGSVATRLSALEAEAEQRAAATASLEARVTGMEARVSGLEQRGTVGLGLGLTDAPAGPGGQNNALAALSVGTGSGDQRRMVQELAVQVATSVEELKRYMSEAREASATSTSSKASASASASAAGSGSQVVDNSGWREALQSAEVHRAIDYKRINGRLGVLDQKLESLETAVMAEQHSSLQALEAVLHMTKHRPSEPAPQQQAPPVPIPHPHEALGGIGIGPNATPHY